MGATAGFTASQPILVPSSQSQELAAFPDAEDLLDYEDLLPAPSLPASQQSTHRSDSPTPSSHLGGNSQDVLMADDQDFIDDQPLPAFENSQALEEAATLTQELEALSPAGSTPVVRPLKRPPPGAFAEDLLDDDADYEDVIEESVDDDDAEDPDADIEDLNLAALPEAQLQDLEADPPAPPALPLNPPSTPPLPGPPASLPPRFATSIYRCNEGGHHPRANGMEVRAAARLYGGTPVGACRYTMPNWWKPTKDEHVQWAEDAFDAALLPRLATCARPREYYVFIHTQGNEARQKAVDVYTAHSELHLALAGSSLVLEATEDFGRITLAPPKPGLPISPRYVPARVKFSGHINAEDAKAALISTFAHNKSSFVVEAWEIYKNRPSGPKFDNELAVLLFVPPVPPPNLPAWAPPCTGMAIPLTERERELLPGFVARLNSKGDELTFELRPKHCWGCKGLATIFHLVELCTNVKVPCGICQKRDHTGITCPRKKDVEVGLLGVPPSFTPAATMSFPQAPALPQVPAQASSPAPAPVSVAPMRPTTTPAATSSSPPSSTGSNAPPSFSYAALTGHLGSSSVPSLPATPAPPNSAPITPRKRPSSSLSSSSTAKAGPSSAPSSSSSAATRVGSASPTKGRKPAKAAKTVNPRPKTRSSAASTAAPATSDGYIQTSLNWGDQSTKRSRPAP
ncbi:hypothetical protein A4X13_0g3016 [Tilletia indica]|uniref:Uncharacterized protein n=1 Tax=Tilletia indica TaxID=43049 RepID=A0A177THN0_9BASI|nr:hypothetical protein A4X13_0g3016 [Tilletia indica]